MLTDAIISRLKEKYGKLFTASVDGVDVVYRTLTLGEFNHLANVSNAQGPAEAEEQTLATVVVWPDNLDLDQFKPGSIAALAESILVGSGFTSAETAQSMLVQKREQSHETLKMIKAFVISTQPSYKDSDLDQFTLEELLEKVALGEQILRLQQVTVGIEETGIEFTILDPEEEEEVDSEDLRQKHQQVKPMGAAEYDDPIAQKLKQALG